MTSGGCEGKASWEKMGASAVARADKTSAVRSVAMVTVDGDAQASILFRDGKLCAFDFYRVEYESIDRVHFGKYSVSHRSQQCIEA